MSPSRLLTACFIFIGLAKFVSADGLFIGCYTLPEEFGLASYKGAAASGKNCASLCSGYTYSYLAYNGQCSCANNFVGYSSLKTGSEGTCLQSGYYEVDVVQTTFDSTICSDPGDYTSDAKGIDSIASPKDCLSACKSYEVALLYFNGGMYCGCADQVTYVSEQCQTSALFILTHPAAAAASELARRNHREAQVNARRAREENICPWGLTACNVPGLEKNEAWECIDTQNDIESCGGCLYGSYNNATAPVGENCLKSGVKLGAATCAAGKCLISECKDGFKLVNNQCIVRA